MERKKQTSTGKEKIELAHLAEATHYRCFDKQAVISHTSKKNKRKV